MIIPRSIKYFLMLAEIRNYRRAARSLDITHSALVRSIKALENYYGVKLFNRGGGVPVTLTDFGEVFLEAARKISRLGMDLRDDLDLMKGLSKGQLSVAFAPFASKLCGHAAVGRLLNKHPGVMIKTTVLHHTRISGVVSERHADIGIAYIEDVANRDEFVIEALGQHLGGIFCRPGHPLLERDALSMAELVKYPWCCTRLPKAYSRFLPVNLDKAGRHDPMTGDFIPALQLDLVYEMADIVANSDILGIGVLLMFRKELDNGKLAILPFRKDWFQTKYSIIYLKHRNPTPAALAFIEEVRSIEKELSSMEPGLAAEFMGDTAPS